jgi:hypothetical protein
MSDQAIEQSPEERMMALLEAEEGEVQEQQLEQPDDEPAAEEAEEVTEEASDEETPERTFKLKRGDEEVEAQEDEVIELAQKGYDYTKKTQALAEERKTLEERAQAVQAQENYLAQQYQLQGVLIKEVAKVEALNDQIEAYEKVDWQALSDSDPVQAQKLFFQYQQLTNQRQKVQGELSQAQQQAQAMQQQRMQQVLAEGYKQLSRDIPDWSAEKAKGIREAAKAYGFNDNELSNVYDPRLVRLMHDAAQFRALQQSKPQVTNKVANKPPVVKPGGKDAKIVAKSNYAKEKEQLRKTGNADLAAKLIERML